MPQHPQTLAIHAAYRADPATRSVTVPLYQTASYLLKSTDQAARIYGGGDPDDQCTYSRYGNPTNGVLEQRIAALEDGVGALGVASGMAAIAYSVLNIAQAGDNIVCSTDVYGSTRNLFEHTFKRFGIDARFVDPSDPKNFLRKTDHKTRVYYGETLPNPSLRVFPLHDVGRIADAQGVPLIVDNTAAPILCRPFEHGAHIVVYSATKYIGGHGAAIGGVVVDGGRFNWEQHGEQMPLLTQPDPSYHGAVWTDVGGRAAYIMKMRRTLLRDTGASLAPANALEFIRGMETLPLRMQQHCNNAIQVVAYLNTHKKIRLVNHPSQHNGLDAERAHSYLRHGMGALVGIEIDTDLQGTKRFIEALELFYHIVNIGDSRSLVTHPASTTHAQLSRPARLAAGVTDTYVRLSIGLEDIRDILADLELALKKV